MAVMVPSGDENIIEQYARTHDIVEVGTDEIEWIDFAEMHGICTEYLRDNFVVAIASPRGAILANIAPTLPSNNANDNNSRSAHIFNRLREVLWVYDANRGLFDGLRCRTFVVAAAARGAALLPADRDAIVSLLRGRGLHPIIQQKYECPQNCREDGSGFLIIKPAPHWNLPGVYLDQRCIGG
ncbi:hypothetical protein SPI_01454 [Niveomyces insectorum RCEF 264]|uniref:Uncharacterized protein n=1 Tax=Niveomyces insectorum RCEF 264 TaxID=1081102 RepID=A0A167YZB9_9HYPO|nr:hypothetical protein SPI_01454 [Niveomyces insectorum RCEF 264]